MKDKNEYKELKSKIEELLEVDIEEIEYGETTELAKASIELTDKCRKMVDYRLIDGNYLFVSKEVHEAL